MTRPSDETLLAFLEGTLDAEARATLLDQLDADATLAEDLRHAAAGLAAAGGTDNVGLEPPLTPLDTQPSAPVVRHGVSPWWMVAAAVVTLMISVPATLQVALPTTPDDSTAQLVTGQPEAPQPSFVLVLHGRWPDAATVDNVEGTQRAEEYWAWTSSLAADEVLVAAGDLRWEPGERLAASGVPTTVSASVVEDADFVVGMFALRVESYEAAMAIARRCPHLRYGGSVSVRRVGGGFVTVPGKSDWSVSEQAPPVG